MILDTLDKLDRYRNLSPLMPLAATFLRDRADDATEGTYELDGRSAFAIVQSYTTAAADTKRWEAHQAYVDVQVILEGVERCGYAPLDTLTVTEAHDPFSDLTWLTDPAGTGSFIRLPSGTFAIFYPWDAHMPGIIADKPLWVRKVVIKLAAESFTG